MSAGGARSGEAAAGVGEHHGSFPPGGGSPSAGTPEGPGASQFAGALRGDSTPATGTRVLEVDGLSVYYGPVRGVSAVSLHVCEGEVVALLGANGAGKTTVLKAISGIVKPRSGVVRFLGRDMSGVKAAARARMGLVQVPEGRRIFPALTVRENLELAAFGARRSRSGIGESAKRQGLWSPFGRAQRQSRQEHLELVLVRFPLLRAHLGKLAGMLSGGEQQVLALARAMMAGPRLLMVDEPSLGLAPQMVESVYELLAEIGEAGTSVLLVEQNVSLAFEVTQRAYVLQNGSLVLSGDSSQLASDPRVVDAYLGAAPKEHVAAPEEPAAPQWDEAASREALP